MQALVYTGTEKLEYKKFQDPNLVKGESIIKVTASGICGSDMHAYHGKDERRVPPLILGHEVSGVIEKGSQQGKKVVLNPLITCGNCDYCRTGSEHLCPKLVLLGMLMREEKSKRYYINKQTSSRTKNIMTKENIDFTIKNYSDYISIMINAITRNLGYN